MKTRRFDFNWRALQVQISLAVEGSVPDKQNYNADTQEYTPDYSLTPLIIQPNVSIIDKDAVLPSGSINHELTNIRWYENVNGTSSQIAADDPDYEITAGGGQAGRIKVKKNIEPKVPVTLEFYAEYVDSRNGQIIKVQSSYLLTCSSASDTVRVELDAADQTVFNPLTDPQSQTVTAKVWLGASECPASRYSLVWEVLGDDGTWHTAGSDELDYDISVNGNKATVNKWLMGKSLHLRCRVKYSADGNPGSVALTAASPSAEVVFVRRIPKFDCEIIGVPYNIPAGLIRIAPSAIIRDTNGEIADAEDELLPLWYIATNKASGTLSYALVGHGKDVSLSTSRMDDLYGGVIGLDVIDRGPVGPLVDSTGALMTDSSGAIFIIH